MTSRLRSRKKQQLFVVSDRFFFSEHPSLFVTIIPHDGPMFPNLDRITGVNVDLVSYINSKVVFTMRHMKAQVDRLFSIFHQERCMMQSRITQNLQTLALLSPREFAYQYFGRPGHRAVARGETIYVARCKAVSVYAIALTDKKMLQRAPC